MLTWILQGFPCLQSLVLLLIPSGIVCNVMNINFGVPPALTLCQAAETYNSFTHVD